MFFAKALFSKSASHSTRGPEGRGALRGILPRSRGCAEDPAAEREEAAAQGETSPR